MSEPWIKQRPVPGRNVVINSQSDFNSWVTNIQTNDLVTQYESAGVIGGNVTVNPSGVVMQGMGHAKRDGHTVLNGVGCWIDKMDLSSLMPGSIVDMNGQDQVVVNNWIHSNRATEDVIGIGSWSTGKGQVLYANAIEGCEHDLYIQNSSVNGTRYVIGNYLARVLQNGNGRLVHAYTQSPNKVESMYFKENVFDEGEVLFGGEGSATPNILLEVYSNWFHKSMPRIGYKRPSQFKFNSNMVLKERVTIDGLWGAGENTYPYPDQSEFKFNRLWYNNFAEQLYLQTMRFVNGVREVGTAPLRSNDNFDWNTYYGTGYIGRILADGINQASSTLTEWRTLTASHGCMYDANSAVVPGPPPDTYWVIPNEYDPTRAMLITWGQVLPLLPGSYTFAEMRDPYHEMDPNVLPAFCLPQELNAFLIRYQTEEGCDLDKARGYLGEAYVRSNQKFVKNRITLALEELDKC